MSNSSASSVTFQKSRYSPSASVGKYAQAAGPPLVVKRSDLEPLLCTLPRQSNIDHCPVYAKDDSRNAQFRGHNPHILEVDIYSKRVKELVETREKLHDPLCLYNLAFRPSESA